jgi:hypothetical protein
MKTPGLGLSFNLRQIECDMLANTIAVDGSVSKGWEFSCFELSVDGDKYEGAGTNFIDGDEHAIIARTTKTR